MILWFPKGKQRIILTYGKHEGVKLVGFLDYETGHVYMEEHKKYDAEIEEIQEAVKKSIRPLISAFSRTSESP